MRKIIFQRFLALAICLGVLGLMGCVSGGGADTTAKPVAASITIALTDPTTGATLTNISSGKPAKVSATVKDTAGAVVPNLVVTFTADATLATMSPSAGTALTDAAGVAVIQISAASLTAAGATTISAAATVGGTALTGNMSFGVTSTSTGGTGISLTLSSQTISMGNPATVTATVKDPATSALVPDTIVTFSIAGNLATLSPSSGTALTDKSGMASIQIVATGPTSAGAATVSATASVGSSSLSQSTSFAVSASTGTPVVSIVLNNQYINWGSQVKATATVWDGHAVVPNTLVTFATSSSLITIFPASGTVLTDASGIATIQVAAASQAAVGAGNITATATIGGAPVSGAANFSVSTTYVGAPSLSIALTDSNKLPVTTPLSSGTTATVTATVLDAAKSPVPGAVVTFSTNASIGQIAPVSATALTNASGVATVTLSPASLTAAGAATITATSQVGTSTVSDSKGYAVGAAIVTIDAPIIGGVSPPAALSAFGTTSVAVTVKSNGVLVSVPQTVAFSSPCAISGKAVLTSSVATVNGVANASYRDNGCGADDPITASVSGIVSSAATTLTVLPPTAGSIQFVSASPNNITLKGMGGLGRQETSQVTFKVVDNGGNPLGGKIVNFSLSTSVGGISFSNGQTTATATSDLVAGLTLGQAVITVNSGNISTPVRVQASVAGANGTQLTTLSDELTITTGIPHQSGFTLSPNVLNIEGWDYDGVTATIKVLLSDHFNNPVPDGTAVNFTTSGGRIIGSCSTTAGDCSVTLNSQEPRPTNGRVAVLAYAVGEESFTDLNGNGVADNLSEMIDVNGISTDLGEAYLDYPVSGANLLPSGSRDANEPFIDFNGSGAYDGPDGKFNGVLCSPGFCSSQKSIHVRKQIVMVFSGSFATITGLPASIDLDTGSGGVAGGCKGPVSVTFYVKDARGNAMPAGTTIDLVTTNGTLSITGFVMQSTNAYPVSALGFSISGDGSIDATTGTCTDTTATGTLTITVKTPKGNVTTTSIAVQH